MPYFTSQEALDYQLQLDKILAATVTALYKKELEKELEEEKELQAFISWNPSKNSSILDFPIRV